MSRNFGCKENGIRKWLKFACKQFCYASEDTGYLRDLNKALLEETGVDVLNELVIQEE